MSSEAGREPRYNRNKIGGVALNSPPRKQRQALEVLAEELTPRDLIDQPPEKSAELIAHALRMSVTRNSGDKEAEGLPELKTTTGCPNRRAKLSLKHYGTRIFEFL